MEVTIAPLGQEIVNIFCLVLAMKHLMTSYNKKESTIADHYTCCISGNSYNFILQYQLCKIEVERYESDNDGSLQF